MISGDSSSSEGSFSTKSFTPDFNFLPLSWSKSFTQGVPQGADTGYYLFLVYIAKPIIITIVMSTRLKMTQPIAKFPLSGINDTVSAVIVLVAHLFSMAPNPVRVFSHSYPISPMNYVSSVKLIVFKPKRGFLPLPKVSFLLFVSFT